MKKTLIEVTPNWLNSGGIFSKMQQLNLNLPWNNNIDNTILDIEFYGNLYGYKNISPLLEKLCTTDTLSDVNLTTLATGIYNMYIKKWKALWDLENAEYNPIENYSMTETYDGNDVNTRVANNVINNTSNDNSNSSNNSTSAINESNKTIGTETKESAENVIGKDVTVETTTRKNVSNSTDTTDVSTYAFNSTTDAPSPTSKTVLTKHFEESENGGKNSTIDHTINTTGTTNTNNTTTNTNTSNTTNTSEDVMNSTSTSSSTVKDNITDTGNKDYTLKRTGNIGVTTSQQMIQSERDLRMWHIFYNVVFIDVANTLTISYY